MHSKSLFLFFFLHTSHVHRTQKHSIVGPLLKSRHGSQRQSLHVQMRVLSSFFLFGSPQGLQEQSLQTHTLFLLLSTLRSMHGSQVHSSQSHANLTFFGSAQGSQTQGGLHLQSPPALVFAGSLQGSHTHLRHLHTSFLGVFFGSLQGLQMQSLHLQFTFALSGSLQDKHLQSMQRQSFCAFLGSEQGAQTHSGHLQSLACLCLSGSLQGSQVQS